VTMEHSTEPSSRFGAPRTTPFQQYATRSILSPGRLLWLARWVVFDLRIYALRQVSHVPTNFARVFLYRLLFRMKIARLAKIDGGCLVLGGPQRITIGEGAVINRGVTLDGRFPLTIGKNASISIHTIILTLQHDLNAPDFHLIGAPVFIGDRAFVGARATILPGVSIGEGAVVAAGAVVVKNVEPFTVVAGVPAKAIGVRSKDLSYELGAVRP
jgi:acetyltransferase-like isoleucine patch superfamily enzyme